ncbi:hypothetical protein [Acidisphaera sp. L21]|uniref:hypothetical protein n=1 Tax=Acidisphaera sp. L21 TaxID=1641851 RepID=UPI00131A6C02|nr:hypothetical protein [Acidisphaera sp. L21]
MSSYLGKLTRAKLLRQSGAVIAFSTILNAWRSAWCCFSSTRLSSTGRSSSAAKPACWEVIDGIPSPVGPRSLAEHCSGSCTIDPVTKYLSAEGKHVAPILVEGAFMILQLGNRLLMSEIEFQEGDQARYTFKVKSACYHVTWASSQSEAVKLMTQQSPAGSCEMLYALKEMNGILYAITPRHDPDQENHN